MKISVIVPVYNVDKYLEECLESILNQTYTNLEIIIVDDGSTDNSAGICDTYAQKDKRIKVIHKENGGLVSARKTGVLCATGEYVSYIDSDDWIEHDLYERVVNCINESNPDVVGYGYIKEYGGYAEYEREYLNPGLYNEHDLKLEVQKFLKENTYFYTPFVSHSMCTKVFRTEIIREKQMEIDNRIQVGEDCVSFACLLEAESIYVMEEGFYHYRVRNNSITHRIADDKYHSYRLLMKYIYSTIKDSYLSDLFSQMAYYYLFIMGLDKVVDEDEIFYPSILGIKPQDRIVLYGKGVVASLLYSTIKSNKVVEWVDSIDADKILSLRQDDYDYILISVVRATLVKKIEKKLFGMGISENKIKRIMPANLLEEKLPIDIRREIKMQ